MLLPVRTKVARGTSATDPIEPKQLRVGKGNLRRLQPQSRLHVHFVDTSHRPRTARAVCDRHSETTLAPMAVDLGRARVLFLQCHGPEYQTLRRSDRDIRFLVVHPRLIMSRPSFPPENARAEFCQIAQVSLRPPDSRGFDSGQLI